MSEFFLRQQLYSDLIGLQIGGEFWDKNNNTRRLRASIVAPVAIAKTMLSL